MSYYINQPIIYTALAETTGMPLNSFSYSWSFDDGGVGSTATLTHSWLMAGTHIATVTATDLVTGATASDSKSIYITDFIPSWNKSGDISIALNSVIYGIAYGNGKYVALIYNQSNGFTYVSTSLDLAVWTTPVMPFPSTRMRDITFGNGIFVIVGDGTNYTSTTGQVNYSTDGITWNSSNSSVAPTNAWQKVVFGGGVFIATSNNGVFMRSSDAITWSTVTVPNRYWTSIVYGGNRFVAISSTLGSTGQVITSTDGNVWAPQNTSANKAWSDIAYGNNLYVAVDGIGSISSPDGITWGAYVNGSFSFIAYGNGKFITVSNSGGYASKHSLDATSWILDASWPSTINPSSAICKARFIGGFFCAAGVSTSTSLPCFAYT